MAAVSTAVRVAAELGGICGGRGRGRGRGGGVKRKTGTGTGTGVDNDDDDDDDDDKDKAKAKVKECDKPVVGYHIRNDSSTMKSDTRIKFMTDGILLREIMSDFLLKKYSVCEYVNICEYVNM